MRARREIRRLEHEREQDVLGPDGLVLGVACGRLEHAARRRAETAGLVDAGHGSPRRAARGSRSRACRRHDAVRAERARSRSCPRAARAARARCAAARPSRASASPPRCSSTACRVGVNGIWPGERRLARPTISTTRRRTSAGSPSSSTSSSSTPQQPEQQVLAADAVVSERARLVGGEHDDLTGLLAEALEHGPTSGAQRREQDDVADRAAVREQHDEPVDPEADARRRRHAVARAPRRSRRRAAGHRRRRPRGSGTCSSKRASWSSASFSSEKPFAISMPSDERLEALDHRRVVLAPARERRELDRVVDEEDRAS